MSKLDKARKKFDLDAYALYARDKILRATPYSDEI